MSRFVETTDLTREQMADLIRQSWPGAIGEARAQAFEALMGEVLPDYARAFSLSEAEVFAALERWRSFSAENFYQRANLPPSREILVYATTADMFAAIQPERGFRCPACGGLSSNGYHCTILKATDSEEGPVCDWSAGGLFGTLGLGVSVVVVEQFRDDGVIHRIFKPVALEQ